MDQKILSEKATQVKDLNLEDLVPTVIDGVTIKIDNGRREISIPDSMNGDKFRTWKKRKGGAFYKDIFELTRGREHGKYVMVTGEDIEYVIRIIEEDEMEEFQARRLVHGKIKDKSFMILYNNSDPNENDEDQEGYIDENNQEDIENENLMIVEPTNIAPDDEETGSAKSISLFD
jgi:hypothetical protein